MNVKLNGSRPGVCFEKQGLNNDKCCSERLLWVSVLQNDIPRDSHIICGFVLESQCACNSDLAVV